MEIVFESSDKKRINLKRSARKIKPVNKRDTYLVAGIVEPDLSLLMISMNEGEIDLGNYERFLRVAVKLEAGFDYPPAAVAITKNTSEIK